MNLNNIEFCDFKVDENLSSYTSFQIGGKCPVVIFPKSAEGVQSALQFATENNLNRLIIGNGTNILFPDKSPYSLVIRICSPSLDEIRETTEPYTFHIQAGVLISTFLEFVTKNSLTGAEFLSGIPGTIGGAIFMNAGAQGKYISEIVKKVEVMDKNYKTYWLDKSESSFEYRNSRFKTSGEIILGAKIELTHGNKEKISTEIKELLNYRNNRLPLDLPSAGCIFKNPKNGPAAYFIELAECKGLQIGGALVSPKHANFILNTGNASYKDVKSLILEVKKRVYDKLNISLETEIIIL
ncbi:MAG: UDP-N-acetylmuramate dehydrogenase [bacterium]|nr:UDP-N-acetylmuramate dehydrogenase [bacterium]